MTLQLLKDHFSVCRLSSMPAVNPSASFVSLSVTPDEISYVGPTASLPENILSREDGWQAFQVIGILDFSLVGILARLTALLAARSIPVFAVSTYNTDYLLIKEEFLAGAIQAFSDGEISILS